MKITNKKIMILSGEGELGTIETYIGKKEARAIKMILKKERCGGDRWANAYQYEYEAETGDVWRDLENDNLKLFNNHIVDNLEDDNSIWEYNNTNLLKFGRYLSLIKGTLKIESGYLIKTDLLWQ